MARSIPCWAEFMPHDVRRCCFGSDRTAYDRTYVRPRAERTARRRSRALACCARPRRAALTTSGAPALHGADAHLQRGAAPVRTDAASIIATKHRAQGTRCFAGSTEVAVSGAADRRARRGTRARHHPTECCNGWCSSPASHTSARPNGRGEVGSGLEELLRDHRLGENQVAIPRAIDEGLVERLPVQLRTLRIHPVHTHHGDRVRRRCDVPGGHVLGGRELRGQRGELRVRRHDRVAGGLVDRVKWKSKCGLS
jgi:hypothetical protein